MFDEIFIKHADYVAKIASVQTGEEQEVLAALLKKLGLAVKKHISTEIV